MALSFRELVCTNVTHEITGAWTFNRGVGTPPFVVTPSPTVATTVTNLSAGAISGVAVSTTPPSAGQVLVASSSSAAAWGAAGASVGDVTDSSFRIVDNGDATKKLAFEVSGITTGTVRTWTVPDASGTIPLLERDQTWTGRQTFANHAFHTGGYVYITYSGNNTGNFFAELTWNSAGAKCGCIVGRAVDTASAANSTLLQLECPTFTPVFEVRKDGAVQLGSWQATVIGATFGGTAQTSWATGDILYATAANTLGKRTIGTERDVLAVNSSGVPAWSSNYQYDLINLGSYDCATIAAGDLRTGILLPYAGRILDVFALIDVAPAGAGGTVALNLEINGTNVTGGVVTVATGDAKAARKDDTAITATNTFTAGQSLDVEASSVVAMSAGRFDLFARVQRDV